MESLVIGLVGALIGAGASIITVWIQSRAQARHERMRLVMELALKDYEMKLDLVSKSNRPFNAPPVTLYLHYHLELAKLLDRGFITPFDIKVLTKENREILRAIKEIADEDRKDHGE